MYYSIDVIYDIKHVDYLNFRKPYLFKGGCSNMKIIKDDNNNIGYLNTELGNIDFPVETYENKNKMGETRIKNYENKNFNIIHEKIINDEKPYHYLAEVDLLETKGVPEEFLGNFELEIDKYRENDGILIFFGNNGKSGCHLHTSHDYILNQIIGEKVVYMFDYYDNKIEFDSILSSKPNFTKENFFDMDHRKMKIYKIELEEGDSLFIPPWWFHAVEGKEINCSITKTYDRSDYLYALTKPHLLLIMLMSCLLDYIEDCVNIVISIIVILIILLIYLLIS